MEVHRRLAPLPPDTAVCLGVFDGLHRGHQALIARARSCAAHVAMASFDPRPVEILAPDRAQPPLLCAAQRDRLAAAMGVEALILIPFDQDLAKRTPIEFVELILVGALRPKVVVVGHDFRFGVGRSGDTSILERELQRAGVGLEVVECQRDSDGEVLSSTAVREALALGRPEVARRILGRWHSLEGRVEHGAGRGRALGFPTANVQLAHVFAPATGVYAALFSEIGRPPHSAVANFGIAPTFAAGSNPKAPALEVHVFDMELGDSLYDRDVEVALVAHLRPEQRFASGSDLADTIRRDIEAARPLLRRAMELGDSR